MPTRSIRLRLGALVLGAALILPWPAAAAPHRSAAPQRQELSAPSLWNFLGQAWGLLTSVWAEEGCMIDPHGGCAPSQSTSHLDIGCTIDPYGLCAPAPAVAAGADDGCMIDPHGCQ